MNDRIPGSCWSNPIWYRQYRIYVSGSNVFNYEYVHDSYDGAEDSHDNRCGFANTIEECKAEIDEKEDV